MTKTKPRSKTPPRPALTNVPPGALRIHWLPPGGARPFLHEVADIAEAKIVLRALVDYDIFQYREHLSPDSNHVGGLQVFKDGQWTEWHNADGSDIRWVMLDEEVK